MVIIAKRVFYDFDRGIQFSVDGMELTARVDFGNSIFPERREAELSLNGKQFNVLKRNNFGVSGCCSEHSAYEFPQYWEHYKANNGLLSNFTESLNEIGIETLLSFLNGGSEVVLDLESFEYSTPQELTKIENRVRESLSYLKYMAMRMLDEYDYAC